MGRDTIGLTPPATIWKGQLYARVNARVGATGLAYHSSEPAGMGYGGSAHRGVRFGSAVVSVSRYWIKCDSRAFAPGSPKRASENAASVCCQEVV